MTSGPFPSSELFLMTYELIRLCIPKLPCRNPQLFTLHLNHSPEISQINFIHRPTRNQHCHKGSCGLGTLTALYHQMSCYTIPIVSVFTRLKLAIAFLNPLSCKVPFSVNIRNRHLRLEFVCYFRSRAGYIIFGLREGVDEGNGNYNVDYGLVFLEICEGIRL